MKVCIIFPMFEEAKPFLENNRLELNKSGPFPHARFRQKSIKVDILISGIGKSLSSACTSYACTTLKPDLILLAGTCCALTSTPVGHACQLVEALECDAPLAKKVVATPHSALTKVIKESNSVVSETDRAILTTGLTADSFLENKKKKILLSNNYLAETYDMESASALLCASTFNTPICVLRVVSDGLNDDAKNFEKNLPEVAKTIAQIIFKFLIELQPKRSLLSNKLV